MSRERQGDRKEGNSALGERREERNKRIRKGGSVVGMRSLPRSHRMCPSSARRWRHFPDWHLISPARPELHMSI